MNITTLSQLSTYKGGVVINLPDFGPGQPFVARISRPSMLSLAASGSIPNSLMSQAGSLFSGSTAVTSRKGSSLGDLKELLEVICESSFLEPTYQEIKEAGVVLTDEQMVFIFKYSQQGTKALEPFPAKLGDNEYPANL